MKDTVSSNKVIKDTNSHTKDFSKLKYKKRLQMQFDEEQESKRSKIEQQKEERNFRTEKRTQLSEKLRDIQANLRNLQKFIESKKLTGKISRETNQLIENSCALIKEANDIFANYRYIYKELDSFIYDEYKLIAINLINKYHNHNDKNSILYETRNDIYNYKYEVFNNSINEHKQILKKIEETNKQLSEELSSLTKSSPSPDQPLPYYQHNNQQEQAILSSPDRDSKRL